jgi:hypothetical protein
MAASRHLVQVIKAKGYEGLQGGKQDTGSYSIEDQALCCTVGWQRQDTGPATGAAVCCQTLALLRGNHVEREVWDVGGGGGTDALLRDVHTHRPIVCSRDCPDI